MHTCDVVVIGAGPGGYVAAIRAAQRGAKVLVVEREELGGVCLNWGCIPTKTLINSAELFRRIKHGAEFGIDVEGASVNMKALLKHKNGVVRRNKSGIKSLFKAHGIEVVNGEGVVTAPGKVAVGDEEIQAKAIIIATGSRPAQLPGLETDGKKIIHYRKALDLDAIPKRAAIIGAGALGAEFGCIWNAFGSEITLIEMMPHVLPYEDEELTIRLEKSFKKKGMDVRTGTKVASLDASGKGVKVQLEGENADTLDVDLVLVAIGFASNSEAVTSTPSLGVKTNERGAILVDKRMETSVPGIYAIGDAIGAPLLAHVASTEGIVAATNATGGSKVMDHRVVPACNFTSPEVASVGMTEKEAREAGVDVKVGRFDFLASGRAQAMGETEGMVKIVGDAATDEVLGLHIMGAEAGELVAAGALAMSMEATVEEIVHTIHTHPTLSEAVLEAAENYFGLGIHSIPK